MVYEGLPGIMTGFIVAFAFSRVAERRPAEFGVYADET
jgi:hypothetical protein